MTVDRYITICHLLQTGDVVVVVAAAGCGGDW